jgi:hypothetical protein
LGFPISTSDHSPSADMRVRRHAQARFCAMSLDNRYQLSPARSLRAAELKGLAAGE